MFLFYFDMHVYDAIHYQSSSYVLIQRELTTIFQHNGVFAEFLRFKENDQNFASISLV